MGDVKRSARVKKPPGHLLLVITEFLYPRKRYEQVFVPTIDDLRLEHAQALAAGRTLKAKWIHARGVAGALMAAVGLTFGEFLRFVVKIG